MYRPLRRIGWSAPEVADPVLRHNYLVIQRDSVAMGVVNAASVFMPVFLVRLGGTTLEVSLLTALPALSAFLFAIPVGSYLQARRNIVPWYARARGAAQLVYAATALAVALVPEQQAVLVVLFLWGAVTIPSTIGIVAFNVVMDGAAGPRGRFDLLSMRWSIMGLATAITVALAGQVLELIGFVLNYQIVFFCFSVAGIASYWYSNQILVPDQPVRERHAQERPRKRVRGYLDLFRHEQAFLNFVGRHFLLTFGIRLAAPLIPLWYVREAHAPDAWIGIFGMGQSLALLVGYPFWRRQSRRRGTALLVLVSTAGMALYPGTLSLSTDLVAIAAITAVAALFSSGVDLTLFDQLMKTIPTGYGITFSAVETSAQNLAAMLGPLLGGVLADIIGIGDALLVSSAVTLLGALGLSLPAIRRRLREFPAVPGPSGRLRARLLGRPRVTSHRVGWPTRAGWRPRTAMRPRRAQRAAEVAPEPPAGPGPGTGSSEAVEPERIEPEATARGSGPSEPIPPATPDPDGTNTDTDHQD